MSRSPFQQPRFQGFSTGGRITWAVQRLILATSAIFALQLLIGPISIALLGGVDDRIVQLLSFRPSSFMTGCLWQPVTYIFLHGGLFHLASNMFTLYLFGPDLERELGTPQFFRFYVFCGAVGVMATLLPVVIQGYGAPGVDAHVLGASGAAMGVLAGFVVLDPKREFILFPLPVPITALGLMVIVLVINVISALDGSGVSVATHFGGVAAGYAYMTFVPRINRWRRRRKFSVVPKPGPKPDQPVEWDKIGKAVNDILKDKEREFLDRKDN